MTAGGSERSLEQELRELRSINELIRTLTSTLELGQILRIVLDRLKRLTQAEALSLMLHDAQRDELVFAATETLQESSVAGLGAAPAEGLASWVARSGESMIVNDVRADTRFSADLDRVAGLATRNLLSVPIQRGGRTVGVIEVANRYGDVPFSEDDRRRLEGLAADAGEGLGPEALCDPDATRKLLARAVTTVPSEAAFLLVLDPAGRELVFRASRAIQPGVVDGLRLPTDRGIAGWVARHREAVRLDDVAGDPRHFTGVERQTGFVPRTMICVPMISKNELRGVIQIINKVDGSAFTEPELQLAQTLADHAAIAIENASLYRQAYVASITDDLTGLGNTRHFNRSLVDLVARGGPVSLVILDLDNFKAVVDGYGHLVGSRTIAQVGRAIAPLIRPGDVAARFGGDEFVIALPDTDTAAATRIAESIRATIEACDRLEGEDVNLAEVTASVGVATFPEHAADAESLFRAADTAMYSVKRAGKNRVAVASLVPPRANAPDQRERTRNRRDP
ncbi:MAG TPA: sensor domain-containing diguanylate cyclase [Candidatus Binatia bacterium]|nr:sensor domain-containing diguanylate cyclase [Candidatus Binatia bacterium]